MAPRMVYFGIIYLLWSILSYMNTTFRSISYGPCSRTGVTSQPFSTSPDSVLRKLVTLISQQALLQAEGEAARKQAESATKAAQAMLEEASKASSKSKEDADNLVRGRHHSHVGGSQPGSGSILFCHWTVITLLCGRVITRLRVDSVLSLDCHHSPMWGGHNQAQGRFCFVTINTSSVPANIQFQ